MKNCILFVFFLIAFSACNVHKPVLNVPSQERTKNENRKEYAIAIHGGAGVILKENLTPTQEKAYRSSLDTALRVGEAMLRAGRSAVDVVEAVVVILEDNPLFNAGKGAVFTSEGKNELDASIMDGKDLKAGAVGAVTNLKNPVKAARAVMEKSPHVLLIGRGAEKFAIENGLDTVPLEYFFTESRWKSLQDTRKKDGSSGSNFVLSENSKFGTVGCVALDKSGNLAAATSTGGMTNKKWGRIGDTPIIGAGTYAADATCAISCTGHGEYFIRYGVARSVADRMELLGESVQKAADFVVLQKLVEAGGEGGLIAVDRFGNIAMPHNSPGMYRGFAVPEERKVMIFKGE
jgi:beta-aspartyl-peptidase (threonine type)